MATRYRSCFDGLSRVSVLTTFQRSRTVVLRISLTASSSDRLTTWDPSDPAGTLAMGHSLEVDHVAVAGHFGCEAESLLDACTQCAAWTILAVREDRARPRGRERSEPVE